MSSRGPLFNCIIANEVVMQLQERGPSFLYLLMRVTLVSAWTGVMKSQNTHSTRAPLLSNTLSVCLALSETRHPPSPSITRRRAGLTGQGGEVSSISAFMFVRASFEIP